jgi:Putative amidoligase enzyme
MSAIDLGTLTFGCEIECTIPSANLVARGWRVGGYHNGALIPGTDGWQATSDGSIHANHYERQGVEVVSPILRGAEGIASVQRMAATLAEVGAKVNVSCGFHVHVGWTGNARQLRRLIHLVAHHEKALFASTGTHNREGNSYCNSIKIDYRSAAQRSGSCTDMAVAAGSRYHVLNLQNLRGGRGTVEFRVFAGTTNPTKMAAYIQLCLGLVQRALESSETKSWDAPVSAKVARENLGEGQAAVRHLLGNLGWYVNGNKRRLGLLVPELLPAMVTELRRLSAQYDGRVAPTAPEAL